MRELGNWGSRTDMQRITTKSFTDLLAWRRAHELSLLVYSVTKTFPVNERRGLTDQLRRASVSVTSNLAEGFGRRTPSDKAYRYSLAAGSLYEIQSQLLISRDLGLLLQEEFQKASGLSVESARLINRLIAVVNGRP